MSNWHSFFKQLCSPLEKDSASSVRVLLCQCEKGSLVFSTMEEYQLQGECSLNTVCAVIQIDKHQIKRDRKNLTAIGKAIYSGQQQTPSQKYLP